MGRSISSTGLNAFLCFLILFTFHVLILGSLKFFSELFPSKEFAPATRLSCLKKDRTFCEPYEEINESLVMQRNSATVEVEVWPPLLSSVFRYSPLISCPSMLLLSIKSSKMASSMSILPLIFSKHSPLPFSSAGENRSSI